MTPYTRSRKSRVDYTKLAAAVGKAGLSLKRFREERREAVRQFVGFHWSDEGYDRPVPLNLIALYVDIVARTLIANHPQFLLTTFAKQHRPVVSAMSDWGNQEVKEMRLADDLGRCVLDALFCLGVMKVGVATPADSGRRGWDLPTGQPYADRIDLDDWVIDVHARDWREASFEGHRMRVPLDTIRDSNLYAAKYRKDLEGTEDAAFNQEGDERIERLGMGYYSNREEFKDFIDIWEFYDPQTRTICTFPALDGGGPDPARLLREVDYVGPEGGPYHHLGFNVVPGNLMPAAPIQRLMDLHLSINNMYRKLLRQAQRLKQITAYPQGMEEDARRFRDADDGDMIGVANPEKMVPIVMGGPNNLLQAFTEQARTIFSWLAGNLDSLGGLAPQAKTAHQDAMLQQNSSATIAAMQDKTVKFTADVIEALCWYWHHHPQKEMTSLYAVPGVPDVTIPRKVTPDARQQVKFSDLRVEVNPYSLPYSTPQSRMAMLDQVLTQVLIPLAPLLQQQGVTTDIKKVLEIKSKYGDLPELTEIARYNEPPPPDEGGGDANELPHDRTLPAQTERVNTRINRSETTGPGQSKSVVQALLGTNPGGSNGHYAGAQR